MFNIATRASRGRAGFSMMEILIVLVLMGILYTIVAPSMTGYLRASRAREAANRLAGDLAYTRMLGTRSGLGSTLVFVSGSSYEVKEGLGSRAQVVKRVELANDYQGTTVVRPAGVDSIIFNSRGMVREGSGTYVVRSAGEAETPRVDSLRLTLLGAVQRGS